MELLPVPIFNDNYVWTLIEGAQAAVVDPGDAGPVLAALDERHLQLSAILITHWHADHIGGIAPLLSRWQVPVYGPRAEADRIKLLTHTLVEGDHVHALDRDFQVMEVPGHTAGHIAYYAPDILLCGDTLFSAGCGRLFEGTPQQMHRSLTRLAQFPPETRVCCTHEYTLSNLAFAQAAEPDNVQMQRHLERVRSMRAAGQPSLPSSLALEREINPFLRCEVERVRFRAEQHAGVPAASPVDTFALLRKWKDNFQAS